MSDMAVAFSYRMHKSGDETVLAIADEEIVGKDFSDKKMTVTISPDFYHEARIREDGVLSLLNSATIINAIGGRIVALLLKNKIVEEREIVTICGLPHAQVFSV